MFKWTDRVFPRIHESHIIDSLWRQWNDFNLFPWKIQLKQRILFQTKRNLWKSIQLDFDSMYLPANAWKTCRRLLVSTRHNTLRMKLLNFSSKNSPKARCEKEVTLTSRTVHQSILLLLLSWMYSSNHWRSSQGDSCRNHCTPPEQLKKSHVKRSKRS